MKRIFSRRTVLGFAVVGVIGLLMFSDSIRDLGTYSGTWHQFDRAIPEIHDGPESASSLSSDPGTPPSFSAQPLVVVPAGPPVEPPNEQLSNAMYGMVNSSDGEAEVDTTSYISDTNPFVETAPPALANSEAYGAGLNDVQPNAIVRVGNPIVDDTGMETIVPQAPVENPMYVQTNDATLLPPAAQDPVTSDESPLLKIFNPHFDGPSLAATNESEIGEFGFENIEAPAEFEAVQYQQQLPESTIPAAQNYGANNIPANIAQQNDVRPGQPPAPASVLQPNANILPVTINVPDSVAQKAALHVEYGKTLARRGATFAARQEFYHGLRLIAQSIDSQSGGTHHTAALNRGIVTLREAEDFHVADSESQMVDNVASIVDAHTCDLISPQRATSVTSIMALQTYYSSAMESFTQASGRHVVSAEALYCLGKLHSSMSSQEMTSEPLDIAKSILFHRVALECDTNHFRSANELGAMLAGNGQAEQAVELFKQSLRGRRTSEAWQNLAVVHQRLNQPALAARAANEHASLVAGEFGRHQISMPIRWMEPKDFNAAAPVEMTAGMAARTPVGPPAQAANELPAPRVSQAPQSTAEPSLLDRVKNTVTSPFKRR